MHSDGKAVPGDADPPPRPAALHIRQVRAENGAGRILILRHHHHLHRVYCFAEPANFAGDDDPIHLRVFLEGDLESGCGSPRLVHQPAFVRMPREPDRLEQPLLSPGAESRQLHETILAAGILQLTEVDRPQILPQDSYLLRPQPGNLKHRPHPDRRFILEVFEDLRFASGGQLLEDRKRSLSNSLDAQELGAFDHGLEVSLKPLHDP